MDADAARLATHPATLALLEAMPPYDPTRSLSLASQLRAGGADVATVTAALTQSRLRAAARTKLGEFAQGMAFTQAGLEQATRLVVAAHHAQRYRGAGIASVADLTCGLGVDSMAMAALGIDVTAFERDQATALLADYNLRHWDHARVVHADALDALSRGSLDVDGVFADPARRDSRGRRHDPSDYSPPLDALVALRDRYPAIGLKVGPAISHDAVPAEAEAEWVSVDGEVVEAGLWMGALASEHGHAALVLKGDSAHRLSGEPVPGHVGTLGEYLYEPDGAVIRAGLVGPLAERIGARLIDPHIAYLTADGPIETPFASGFRILETMPFAEKSLAQVLAARGVGRAEIKKRGIDVDPDALRKRLRLKGERAMTVVLTRIGDSRLAILAERLPA